ncbi:MAG: choice-of-anchor B family protein [Bacteroidota bacterium]
MIRYLTLLFVLFGFFQTNAQVSMNVQLLGNYDDNTIPDNGSSQFAYNDIWGYAADGREYAIVGSAAYIHFFDVTNPWKPTLIDQFAGGDTTVWRDIKTFGKYAYAVSDRTLEGMMIFDLSSLPDSIIKVDQTDIHFSEAHNIFIDEPNGRLYAAGTDALNNGLIVLDLLNDPEAPELIGNDSLVGGGYVHDVYVRDNIAYCSHGFEGLYVWDYTDPAEPVLKANVLGNGYNHSSWLTEDGKHILFAEEIDRGLPLGIADLSLVNDGSIEVKNYFQFPLITDDDVANTPHNPFIRGNYAFVSYYEDGVQIFDLTDPENPVLAGYYDTFPNNTNYAGYFGNWGVYPFLPSGIIIASDRKYGLFTLNFLGWDLVSYQENDFYIFPNPSSSGIFNIVKSNAVEIPSQLEIFDISGRRLHTQVLNNEYEEVNLSHLSNGFYVGIIESGDRELVKKLVIAR